MPIPWSSVDEVFTADEGELSVSEPDLTRLVTARTSATATTTTAAMDNRFFTATSPFCWLYPNVCTFQRHRHGRKFPSKQVRAGRPLRRDDVELHARGHLRMHPDGNGVRAEGLDRIADLDPPLVHLDP